MCHHTQARPFPGPLSSTLRTTCCEAFRTRISPSVFSCGCSAATWAEPEERECLCEQKMIHAQDTICLLVKHFRKWCNATIEHGFSQEMPQLNQLSQQLPPLFAILHRSTCARVLQLPACLDLRILTARLSLRRTEALSAFKQFHFSSWPPCSLTFRGPLECRNTSTAVGKLSLWKPLDEMGGLSHLSWRMDQPILAARMGRPDPTPTLP